MLNIASSKYETELDDLQFMVKNINALLIQNRVSNLNMTDKLDRVSFKNEERRMKVDALELELSRSCDDVIYLKRDSLALLK